MNEIRMNDAHGARGRSRAGNPSRPAGHRPAQVTRDPAGTAQAPPQAPPAGAAQAPPEPALAGSPIPLPAQRRPGLPSDGSVPLRLVQVYLTPAIDEFLRQARSTAIMAGLDVSASAVVRHAMERLIATTSPAAMVELLGSPKGQSQPRRGRPRRL